MMPDAPSKTAGTDDLATWTLVHALASQAARRGEQTFCSFASGASCTFAGIHEASNRLASILARRGVAPGDRVVVIGRNGLPFLTLFFAVQKRRAVLVPINVELHGELLAQQLETARPKMIFADDTGQAALAALTDGQTAAVFPLEEVDSAQPGIYDPRHSLLPAPTDVCLVLFTSGTSGRSKGVLVPQAHAYLFSRQQVDAVQLAPDDIYYVCLPMFHVNALLMSLGACLLAGAKAHVASRFSASTWIDDIRAIGATVTNALGVMAEFVMVQPEKPDDGDNRLGRVMAVPVSARWGADFERRFGTRLIQVYGMTECNIVAYSAPGDELVAGCTGPITRETYDVTIQDSDTGRLLPPNSVGEICVRPRVPSAFMTGYLDRPEVTVAAWRGLWFHTGDAGRIDEQDRLHFVDRMGDTLRRRGENISSVEIEQVIAGNPLVAECAVVGIRVDGSGGEDEVKACIVTHGVPFDHRQFISWCADRLPRYMVPRFVEALPSLPRTETGKVQKSLLRASGLCGATWDREKSA